MLLKGKALIYGDDINTDVIFPGRYLEIIDANEMAKHAMEDLDPQFLQKAMGGCIIVAGKNFGCGSSREQAATCLKYAGTKAIIARSFARIFYRNAINSALPVFESEEVKKIREGDEIEVHVEDGVIKNLTKGEEYRVKPLPSFLQKIIMNGGLIKSLQKEVKNEV